MVGLLLWSIVGLGWYIFPQYYHYIIYLMIFLQALVCISTLAEKNVPAFIGTFALLGFHICALMYEEVRCLYVLISILFSSCYWVKIEEDNDSVPQAFSPIVFDCLDNQIDFRKVILNNQIILTKYSLVDDDGKKGMYKIEPAYDININTDSLIRYMGLVKESLEWIKVNDSDTEPLISIIVPEVVTDDEKPQS